MEEKVDTNLSFVSVIVPCRNEAHFIGPCLESIALTAYPKDLLEVFVVDGMSDDATRQIAGTYIQRFPYIVMVDNPRKITSCALNLAIKRAKGELIVWMSAHNVYPADYINKCVEYSREYETDNVGGTITAVQRDKGLMGKAIVSAISHPFGVGNSLFRIGARKPVWTDTVFGGCYKRSVFEKIGLFNEKLLRGQDMELNLRFKKAGFKTLLVPEIKSAYHARSDLRSFLKHNFSNGMWALLPFKYSNIIPVSFRHLVPLFFVLSLLIFFIASFYISYFYLLSAFLLAVYFTADLFFSSVIAAKEGRISLFFLMILIFPLLHLSYGLGSFIGLLMNLGSISFWKNILCKSL